MTNKEILDKAIDKAEKNGWVYPINEYQDNYYLTILEVASLFIFTHEFAKAFFGEEWEQNFKYIFSFKPWEHHLQQMVLEEEPLKYLENFL